MLLEPSEPYELISDPFSTQSAYVANRTEEECLTNHIRGDLALSAQDELAKHEAILPSLRVDPGNSRVRQIGYTSKGSITTQLCISRGRRVRVFQCLAFYACDRYPICSAGFSAVTSYQCFRMYHIALSERLRANTLPLPWGVEVSSLTLTRWQHSRNPPATDRHEKRELPVRTEKCRQPLACCRPRERLAHTRVQGN